jgi:hypothetical protein
MRGAFSAEIPNNSHSAAFAFCGKIIRKLKNNKRVVANENAKARTVDLKDR